VYVVTIVEVALFRASVYRSGARPGLKNGYRPRNANSFGVTSKMPEARFTQNVVSPPARNLPKIYPKSTNNLPNQSDEKRPAIPCGTLAFG